MNPFRTLFLPKLSLVVLIASLGLAGPASAKKEEPPPVSPEGLHLVKDSKWGVVYVDPEADLSPYTKVQLLEPYVAFRKNWKRDQNRESPSNRASDKDMEDIKKAMAREFDEIFRDELPKDNGFEVVDVAGSDTLLLRPAIVDLDPTAPDLNTPGTVRTFSESAGEMTLYLEIYDSVTGALIAKGIDGQADRQAGYMTWQTRASNTAAADRILRKWAKSLRKGLEEAKSKGVPASEG